MRQRRLQASNVLTTRDGVHRAGFTYHTLTGHAIHGEESFVAEKNLTTGDVAVRIIARSCAATWLCSVARAIARRLQRRAGNAGVEHLQKTAAAVVATGD